MTPTEALKRACAQNKTYKALVARIEAFRAREGRPLDAVYISPETNMRLPEALRVNGYRRLLINEVPIGLLQILPPDGFYG